MRPDRHKNKGGGLLGIMKNTIPFVDITAALPQAAYPHLEQQCISTTMPNRRQLYIHNIYIPPRSSCSAGHNASIAHLLCNNEMSLIVGDANAHHSRWDTNTNHDERGEQLADKIDAADHKIHNEKEATRLPINSLSTSPDSTPLRKDTGVFESHGRLIIVLLD